MQDPPTIPRPSSDAVTKRERQKESRHITSGQKSDGPHPDENCGVKLLSDLGWAGSGSSFLSRSSTETANRKQRSQQPRSQCRAAAHRSGKRTSGRACSGRNAGQLIRTRIGHAAQTGAVSFDPICERAGIASLLAATDCDVRRTGASTTGRRRDICQRGLCSQQRDPSDEDHMAKTHERAPFVPWRAQYTKRCHESNQHISTGSDAVCSSFATTGRAARSDGFWPAWPACRPA